MEYTLIGIVWSFCMYSFLGWVLEEIYASLADREFTNRGMLYGCVCPIYGIGANIFLLLLTPFRKNFVMVYFVSVCAATILEFVAGLVLEKIFNQKWWDYTQNKYNVMGYVCPKFSLLWGVACFVLMYILHPISLIIFGALSYYQIRILIAAFWLIFLSDGLLTLLKLNHVQLPNALVKYTKYLKLISNDIGMFIFDRVMFAIKVREYAEKGVATAGKASKAGIIRTRRHVVALEAEVAKMIKQRFSR